MPVTPPRHPAVLALPFALVWASAFPATKIALADGPPMVFLALRFALAGVLMLGWAVLRREDWRPRPRDWGPLFALAACNHAIYLGLSWHGMQALSSGLASVIIGASPIVVSALAVLLLGERMTGRRLLGLALGFAGVVYVVRHRIGGGGDTLHGALLVLAALLTLSVGTILYKRVRPGVGVAAGVAWQLLLAALIAMPWSLATEDWRGVHPTPGWLGALAWAVLAVSIGGYTLWFALLRSTDAARASAWMFLTPPLGLLMGWGVVGERLVWADFLGVLPVVLGIVLVTLQPPAAGVRGLCSRDSQPHCHSQDPSHAQASSLRARSTPAPGLRQRLRPDPARLRHPR